MVTYSFLGWLRTESNRRHKDFQSFALPTELLSLIRLFLPKRCLASSFVPIWQSVRCYKVNYVNGGPDGTRTRDLLRDRQAF